MIIAIIIFAILLFIYIKMRFINTSKIKKMFKKLSITIFGKRGTGKDTLCSYITYEMTHNSNVKLHPNTEIINLKDVLIPDLTRQKLVDNQFEPIDKDKFKKFEHMTIVSDAGIYFPSYDDAKLKNEYNNLAISIAIWRHLYDAPIHFNCQNFDRLWKILREQVEDSIQCLKCKYFKHLIYMKVRYYESPKDAVNGLKPIKHRLLKHEENVKIEESKRFEIKEYRLLIPRRMVEHDSWFFRYKIFNEWS